MSGCFVIRQRSLNTVDEKSFVGLIDVSWSFLRNFGFCSVDQALDAVYECKTDLQMRISTTIRFV